MGSNFCGICVLLLTPYPCSESLVTQRLLCTPCCLRVPSNSDWFFVKGASNFLRFPVASLTHSVLPEQGMFSFSNSWLPAVGSCWSVTWLRRLCLYLAAPQTWPPLCRGWEGDMGILCTLCICMCHCEFRQSLLRCNSMISSCQGKGISPLLLASVEHKGCFGVTCEGFMQEFGVHL